VTNCIIHYYFVPNARASNFKREVHTSSKARVSSSLSPSFPRFLNIHIQVPLKCSKSNWMLFLSGHTTLIKYQMQLYYISRLGENAWRELHTVAMRGLCVLYIRSASSSCMWVYTLAFWCILSLNEIWTLARLFFNTHTHSEQRTKASESICAYTQIINDTTRRVEHTQCFSNRHLYDVVHVTFWCMWVL